MMRVNAKNISPLPQPSSERQPMLMCPQTHVKLFMTLINIFLLQSCPYSRQGPNHKYSAGSVCLPSGLSFNFGTKLKSAACDPSKKQGPRRQQRLDWLRNGYEQLREPLSKNKGRWPTFKGAYYFVPLTAAAAAAA